MQQQHFQFFATSWKYFNVQFFIQLKKLLRYYSLYHASFINRILNNDFQPPLYKLKSVMDKDAVVDAQLRLNYFLNRILKRCNIFIFNGIENLLSILAQYTFILIFNSLHAYRAVNGINNTWTHNYFMHWLKASYLQFPCVK